MRRHGWAIRQSMVVGLVLAAGIVNSAGGQCLPGPSTELRASDAATSMAFGGSVAISGTTAIIGSPGDASNTVAGAAYVFENLSGTWTQTAILTASDGFVGQDFGVAVDVDGDVAVVSADYDSHFGTNSGAAYVFERSGTVWTQVVKLLASDGAANDQFGYWVGVSGTTIMVGAPFANLVTGTTEGAVYVFDRIGGVWTETAKLAESDGGAGINFGTALEIEGNRAVIGGPGAAGAQSFTGAAYIFERSGGVWTQTAKLTATAGRSGDAFGSAVSLSANTVAASSPLAYYLTRRTGLTYTFDRQAGVWSQTAELIPYQGVALDLFGASLVVRGNTLLATSKGADFPTSGGKAYLYERAEGIWLLRTQLRPPDVGVGDWFGYCSAIDGNSMMIGSIYHDHGLINSGSMYAYELVGAPCIQTQPASQSVCVGEPARFTVVAAGASPLTYQWMKNTSPILGATLSTYTIPVVAAPDAASYTVTINNSFGSATSNAATLSIVSSALCCRGGNVNVGAGSVANVLLVNGSAGDANREVTNPVGSPVQLSLNAAPAGPATGARYVMWVWLGTFTSPVDLTAQGTAVGCAVNPTPLHRPQAPQPFRCLRSPSVPALVCRGVQEMPGPATAPWTITSGPIGRASSFIFQALLRENAAGNPTGFSVTNAVFLHVQ